MMLKKTRKEGTKRFLRGSKTFKFSKHSRPTFLVVFFVREIFLSFSRNISASDLFEAFQMITKNRSSSINKSSLFLTSLEWSGEFICRVAMTRFDARQTRNQCNEKYRPCNYKIVITDLFFMCRYRFIPNVTSFSSSHMCLYVYSCWINPHSAQIVNM